MAAAAQQLKRKKTGEGLMFFEKWGKYAEKKKESQQKERKKKRDRMRYLAKKLDDETITVEGREELEVLQKTLKKK